MFRDNDKIHEVKIINGSDKELRFTNGRDAVRGKLIIVDIIKNINNFTLEGATTIDIYTVAYGEDEIDESKWKRWQSIPRNFCSIVYDVM